MYVRYYFAKNINANLKNTRTNMKYIKQRHHVTPLYPAVPPPMPPHDKELHVAPLLDYSKREFRALFSILSSRTVLWTDMLVDETLAHCSNVDDRLSTDHSSFLGHVAAFDNRLVCQIGGDDPNLCRLAVRTVAASSRGGYGYSEVNLNVDCPSEKVVAGKREFGAILMRRVDRCVDVVRAMVRAAAAEQDAGTAGGALAVSVKCRVGVEGGGGSGIGGKDGSGSGSGSGDGEGKEEDCDTFEYVSAFIRRLRYEAGCRRFVLHARKCVLGKAQTKAEGGDATSSQTCHVMSARHNRTVPPLNYPRVYDLCRAFPDCDFWINGGVNGLKEARELCFGRCADENGRAAEHAAAVGSMLLEHVEEEGTMAEKASGSWVRTKEKAWANKGGREEEEGERTEDHVCRGVAEEKKEDGGKHAEDDDDDDNNDDDDAHAEINHNKNDNDINGGSGRGNRRRYRTHSVPCALCSRPNGSCVAPPPHPAAVPSNLRGVMMGRAAIRNPCLFWDADRYFYGTAVPPMAHCRTRRDVLDRYATYLEQLYPRRCCDDCDDVVTCRIPAPNVVRVRDWCVVCRGVYDRCRNNNGVEIGASIDISIGTRGDHGGAPLPPTTMATEMTTAEPKITTTTDATITPLLATIADGDADAPHPRLPSTDGRKVKISSRIIGRSLKPIRGVLYGMPGCKAYVRELDRWGSDLTVRNCGPGFILRMAIATLEKGNDGRRGRMSEVLDRPLVRTEDLP